MLTAGFVSPKENRRRMKKEIRAPVKHDFEDFMSSTTILKSEYAEVLEKLKKRFGTKMEDERER